MKDVFKNKKRLVITIFVSLTILIVGLSAVIAKPPAGIVPADDDWTGAGTGQMYNYYLDDFVGIGTDDPTTELDVYGTTKSTYFVGDGSGLTGISESQITGLDYFTNGDEIDPVYTNDPAYSITASNITNWDNAYSWGNHNDAGYIKSFIELDPTVPASVKDGVDWSELTGVPIDILDGDDGFTGSLSNNYIPKWSGSDLVDSTIYNSNTGLIGIGIDAPQTNLDVVGNMILRGSESIYSDAHQLLLYTSGIGSTVGSIFANLYLQSDEDYYTIIEKNGGNVGIGITEPNHNLDVANNIALGSIDENDDDYLYFDAGNEYLKWDETESEFVFSDSISWETKTSYISISAASFRPSVDGYDYVNGGFQLKNNNNLSDYYYAPVQLPHNSEITSMTIRYYDNDRLENGYVTLWRQEPSSAREIFTATTSTKGITTVSDPYFGTVDNSQYSYYLELYLPSKDVIFNGINIEYEFSAPY